MIYDLIVVVD